MRLANIELPKNDEWAKRQRGKGIFKRMYEVISEPRYKFYVKEGRTYTMKSGVPGVWEQVANRIQEQTAAESATSDQVKSSNRKTVVRRPTQPIISQERVKRQTARALKK
jgi:hypothetical protein